MKHYNYSVKDVLTSYYGCDPITEMQRHESSWYTAEQKEYLVPLLWKYAHERALRCFSDEYFLTTTELCDDYIVFHVQYGKRNAVFLMFALIEEEEPFIAIPYAKMLLRDWAENGYESYIFAVYAKVDEAKDNRFYFSSHSGFGRGTQLYRLTNVNGQELIADATYEFYTQLYQKLSLVSRKSDIKEWECLFEPDAKIILVDKQDEKNNKTLANGLEKVKMFLTKDDHRQTPQTDCLPVIRNMEIPACMPSACFGAVKAWGFVSAGEILSARYIFIITATMSSIVSFARMI